MVKFSTKMFHPNIYTDGSICLDILQNRWSPTYDVAAILTSIQSLVSPMLHIISDHPTKFSLYFGGLLLFECAYQCVYTIM